MCVCVYACVCIFSDCMCVSHSVSDEKCVQRMLFSERKYFPLCTVYSCAQTAWVYVCVSTYNELRCASYMCICIHVNIWSCEVRAIEIHFCFEVPSIELRITHKIDRQTDSQCGSVSLFAVSFVQSCFAQTQTKSTSREIIDLFKFR